MNEQEGIGTGYDGMDDGYAEPIEAMERDPLPAPLPAVREWLAAPLGLAGLACLGGAAAFAADALGLVDHAAVDSATASLASVGATPALLAIGGATLVGLAAGAFGRMRQTKRTLAALAQSPDYGAWLEDLDEGLQRMHVSLVTVESHVAGAVDGVRTDLARRIDHRASADDARSGQLEQQLGGRLMRLEASIGTLSATLARVEERDAATTEDAMTNVAPLVQRLEATLDALGRLAPSAGETTAVASDEGRDEGGDATVDAPTNAGTNQTDTTTSETGALAEPERTDAKSVEPVTTESAVAEAPPTNEVPVSLEDTASVAEPILTQVDEPAPAMPAESNESECPVEGLPLFAAVENPAPKASEERAEAPRRNPYDG